jgi:glycosyltransferase involved in cell wall biosynthesis
MNLRISILLATYNSGFYLSEQLDSIINQTEKSWSLFIRDDGSEDNTLEIITEYCNNYSNIVLLNDNDVRLGPSRSFIRLLTNVDSDYYFFCDHDDVWLPDKVKKTIQKLKKLETSYPNKPILVHTDLKVVDCELNILYDSLWKLQKVNPSINSIYYLLANNNITGCTMGFNHQAKVISLPMGSNSLMHDVWIALNVSHYGYIGFLTDQTVLYRQHSSNVLGASAVNFKYYIRRLKAIKEVLNDNINILSMVGDLPFKINYYSYFIIKLKVLTYKMFNLQ